MTVSEDMAPITLSNRYRVLSVIGDGGFGKTFLVEDTQMPSNRQCVLKQLKPVHDNPQTGQMVKDRFQREAAILETLGEGHEQIPRLYAYFSEADQFYLVEEWVEGDTLTQRVQREGPLPEKTVQNLVASLLPVIAHVHSEGIVHRDIKPDNVILRSRDSKPVLIDFGAVKETMNTLINSHENSAHSIVVGTPGYMPSEQLAGRPVYASDLYSLGMTAIYALTGRIPQDIDVDPSTGELMWRQLVPNLTPEFGNFLDCATHMSASSRFPVVKEMQSILNNIILNGMAAPATGSAMPETRQSSQTIVSAPPDPEYPTVAAAPAASYSYQSPDSAHTQIASPVTAAHVANAATVQQPARPSGQWKSAVIIGGMVGFSVLLGALFMMDRLSSDGRSEQPAVVGSVEEKTPERDADANPEDKPGDRPKLEDREIPAQTPVNPVVPAQPRAASVPGANSTIVGQPGSKNVRSGAGTNYGVVDAVSVGDRVKVVARDTDGGGNPWYRVVVPSGNSGWVAGQLLQVDGDAAVPKLPAAQKPPEKPGEKPGEEEYDDSKPTVPVDSTNATVMGEAGSKNVRSGPGTSYGTAHVAYPGDRVYIRDSATDAGGFTWHKVYFPKSGAEGWMASQLVKPD